MKKGILFIHNYGIGKAYLLIENKVVNCDTIKALQIRKDENTIQLPTEKEANYLKYQFEFAFN